MLREFVIVGLLAWMAVGCSSPRSSLTPLRSPTDCLFPPEALVTQRGVLTVRGRQFTLNGYVAKSDARGLRLILMGNLGGVLADVLVDTKGTVVVKDAKPPFRPEWVERFIAADLQCLFSKNSDPSCPVEVLSPTHFVVKRPYYQLDLRTVDIKPGEQAAKMFAK